MATSNYNRVDYAKAAASTYNGEVVLTAAQIKAGNAFPLAVALGFGASIICTVAYAYIWSFGFMLGVLAVGFAWVITSAMLAASGGYGGKLYQIVAVIFTYFTITFGKLLEPFVVGLQTGNPMPFSDLVAGALFGPILRLQLGISGILGIFVLGYAVRKAWSLGKGTKFD